MRLEKVNKYAKKKVIGISTFVLSMTMLIAGCNNKNKEEVIETPEPTATISITNTPTPTPNPTATPRLARMKKLEGEELEKAIEELCIQDKKADHTLAYYAFCAFTTGSGENKFMIVYRGSYNGSEDELTVFDAFTNEELFEFKDISGYYCINVPTNKIKSINPYFEGAKIEALHVLPFMICYYSDFGIEPNREIQKEYYGDNITLDDVHFTNGRAGEYYVNMVPEAFRVKASDLNREYQIDESPKVKQIG